MCVRCLRYVHALQMTQSAQAAAGSEKKKTSIHIGSVILGLDFHLPSKLVFFFLTDAPTASVAPLPTILFQ